MKYIEAYSDEHEPFYRPHPHEVSLFLAGGISNCADWQAEVVKALADTDVAVLNPRRANFNIDDPNETIRQITWEFDHLQKATAILFWFPPETLCPITLFEYGKWLVRNKPLFVGCHPGYKRIDDVRYQTRLERPLLVVHTDLNQLLDGVRGISQYAQSINRIPANPS